MSTSPMAADLDILEGRGDDGAETIRLNLGSGVGAAESVKGNFASFLETMVKTLAVQGVNFAYSSSEWEVGEARMGDEFMAESRTFCVEACLSCAHLVFR